MHGYGGIIAFIKTINLLTADSTRPVFAEPLCQASLGKLYHAEAE